MKLGELREIGDIIAPFAKTSTIEKLAAVIFLNYPPNHTPWPIPNGQIEADV